MSSVSIDGVPVSAARFYVPGWGIPWMDLRTTEPLAKDRGDLARVDFAGMPVSMTVASGGEYEGTSRFHLVGGRGGWGRVVPDKSYRNDSGVQGALVVSDLAAEVGEQVEAVPQSVLGPHYARRHERASLVLHELFPSSWRVDLDGVTRFGARPSAAYQSDATVTRVDKAARIVEFRATEVGSLVPGLTFEGRPAVDLEYEVTPEALTVRAYLGPSGLSRRLAAYAAIFRALFPRVPYLGKYEFRVVAQSGMTLALQPVRASTGLHDLDGVPMRPGMAGLSAEVTPGSLVLVEFIEGDPSRPVVTGFDDPASPGWRPPKLTLSSPAIEILTDLATVADGSAAVTRDDRLQAALSSLKPLVKSALQSVGESVAASGSAAALAWEAAAASWPGETAADKLKAD